MSEHSETLTPADTAMPIDRAVAITADADAGYAGYLPIPHWDGERWRACDHRVRPSRDEPQYDGYNEVAWPDLFEPKHLPPPSYNPGDQVAFFAQQAWWRGTVKRVTRHGGPYTRFEANKQAPCLIARSVYALDSLYDVVASNGQTHVVSEYQVRQPSLISLRGDIGHE